MQGGERTSVAAKWVLYGILAKNANFPAKVKTNENEYDYRLFERLFDFY